MELSIIIVNYKTPELTHRCIESVKNTVSEACQYEIIVVDNHSQDHSETDITRNFPDVKWINNPKNEGFGRANNIGIKQAVGEYILLLNSDMIVLPGTIEKCLEKIKSNENIGALGCQLLNEDGTKQKSTYPYIAEFKGVIEKNLVFDYLIQLKNDRIQGIMGSFILIPKKIINETGPFDPDFFMYSEEIELCHRVQKAGYKIECFTQVSAIHAHGASSNKAWAMQQNYLSNALLFYKIRGLAGYLLYHILFLTNTITNFVLMWRFNKAFRKDYWFVQKAYYSNYLYYFTIPFLFTRKMGNGKRLLRIK